MPSRKSLPLEEKLKIPVMKLPFSKDVKKELYYKGALDLRSIYYKYQRYPGRCSLAGFKDRVYLETAYLIIAIGLDTGEYSLAKDAAWKIGWLDKNRRKKINKYASEES